MRLPKFKVYRAFPELDPFPDSACEKFVVQAKRRRWVSRMLLGLACGAVVAVVGPLTMVLVWAGILNGMKFLGCPPESVEAAWMWAAGVVMLLGFGASFIAAMSMRDAWLRWAIKGLLTRTSCAGCNYSLLGLLVTDGHIQCPECGIEFSLAQNGLTEDMLIAGVLTDKRPEVIDRLIVAKSRAFSAAAGKERAD